MKSFRNKTFRAVVSAITLIATTSVYSGPPRTDIENVDIVPVHPMYLGTLTGGLKTNDSYTEGNFSIVAPIWSNLGADNTLSGGSVFLEPYISWGEGGEVVSSLGLGYRYLFGNQPISALTMHDGHQAGFLEEGVAIGANIFIDMLDTEANNQLWQLGVGAELQTRYLELRGNYYIPLSDKQLAEQSRTRRTFTSSNSSTSTFQGGSGVGDPYATGNTIAQDVNLSTYATTTTRTTTTTIEQLFRRYEEGMEGWDAEMAVLVPGLDRYFDLRLIGGYYSFDNQPFGPQTGGTGNVQGWKAGVEVRPVPAVILNGTWYEDARLTGSDWTVGLQLQMPFEGGDLGDGKDFWDRIGDSFKPRRRHLIERLAEPVRRQNAAIKVANSFDEDTRVISEKTNVKRVTKVLQQTNQRLVLMDDVIFVNNGAATGNGIQTGNVAGTGTAEQPVNTIQAGATIAGSNSTSSGRVWNVYTQGGAVYAENVLATTGSVNLISSGRLIAGQGGKSFGTGDVPTVAGGFNAVNIPSLGVTSYLFTNGGGGSGVRATNVTNLVLDEVTVQGAFPDGISIAGQFGTASLIDVTVNGAIGTGVTIQNGNPAAVLAAQNLDISGTTGIALVFEVARGTFNFDSESSISGTNGTGMVILGGDADVVFNGDIAQPDNGLAVLVSDGHTGDVTFQNGTVSAAGGDGLRFSNADGTYRFLGTTTLTGPNTQIRIVNGSGGDFEFGADTTVSSTTAENFYMFESTANVNFAGTISNTAVGNYAVYIGRHSVGTLNFTGSISATGGNSGIIMSEDSGTYRFANFSSDLAAIRAVGIFDSSTAVTTFDNLTVNRTGIGLEFFDAGTVNILDGSIDNVSLAAINSTNTTLNVSSVVIGAASGITTPVKGILVNNTDGVARVVTLTNNSIRSQSDAVATTDSGIAGELTLILNGNTYEATTAGGKAINVVGSGLDSTTVRSMNGGTVVGNGVGGGVFFDQVTFDSDGATAGNQAVAAGNWNIGQGTSARVSGDGLRFDAPTGEVTFGTLNIFNDGGTGLYVDTKTLGTTFTLNNTGGSINTTNGAATFLDPLTVNLTFSSVSSTNSGTSGIYLDEVAGTLNLGNVTITNSAAAAYVQEDSTVAVTAGTVNITNAGGDGMVFNSAGGSFTVGATTISGFNGTGVNFTGSGVNATFGVTTISNALNGGTGTGIDLSNTTGNAISFAGGSSISNVAVGVELSASGTTATSANALFTFGDGEGAINKLSSINAAITVNASGLAATGLYNFQDVNFTGVAGFPAAAGSALFVSATAVDGVGDGSLLNPYSVADADAIAAAGIFAFLDGSYDFATLNGGTAFSLSNGQSVVGLDNSAAVTYGTTQPLNVLGDFGLLGGNATRANTGNGTLSIINSVAANVFELGGSNTISNITVNGSANTGALFSGNGTSGVIINGVAISSLAAGNTALSFTNMTGNVTAQGNNINTSAGTLLSINGGNATYSITKGTLPGPGATPGTLAGATVNISNLTGGAVTLDGASITSLNVTGTLAGSTVNVNNTTITGGAGVAVNIGNSAGALNFNAATSIEGGTGVAFSVNGGTGDIIHNGTITQNNAASAVFIINRTGGATTFNGGITANTSTAIGINLQNNTGSTTNFNGGFSLGTTTATGFNATNGGTLNVAAAPSATINTTEGGRGLYLNFGVTLGSVNIDSITVTDGLSSGTAGAVLIGATSGGSLTIGDISVERATVDAISISNVTSGTYAFTGLTSVNSTVAGANGIDISNTAAGASISFANINLTTVNGGSAVLLNNNVGSISFNDGQINRVTGGDGINSTDSNLTVSSVQIGNNTTFAVSGRGINITNTGTNVRTVTLTDNNIRSGTEAIRTTDNSAGTLLLSLNGNTLQTTSAGVKTVHITGSGPNSTIITGFNGGVVTGNNTSGGVFIDRATFDASGQALSGTQVAAGTWNIGQGTGNRVVGDGWNFTNPSGSLNFTTLNIFNNNGTGLLVNAKTTTFALAGGGSGTIDTTNGTALNLDPLTTNLTFGTVTSTNSGAGNPGVIFDAVAGSVTIGTLNVTNAGTDGFVVQNSSANVTLTNINITTAGGDGIRLVNNTGSFNTTAGGATVISDTTGDGIDLTGLTANPTVSMLGTVGITDFGGIGVNFTGANVTAAFGVTTINNIANGGTGTAIDLSSTAGTRNITFAAGSAISNVAVGVQLGATAPTAANASFFFGDGMSGNGLQSSISATTTVAALGLDPAPNSPGVYNFNDVTFTGSVLFPSAPGGAVFVSATALNGVGDGSLANPYSVADANALTGTLTFGFLDGTYNFAALGNAGFTLEANQSAAGLDNGNGISYGVLQPNRVLGNFGVLGGTATRANTGNGTLSITSGNTAGTVFALLGGNTVSHLTLTGEAGVNDPGSLLSINSVLPGFNNAGGISVQGMTMGNVQAGNYAISMIGASGTILIQNNNISTPGGNLLAVSGGTAAISVIRGTGTLSGRHINVSGTTGGSVQITGASVNSVGNTAVALNSNAASVTLTGIAVSRTAGDTAFAIDTGFFSTGAITINGASTLDATAGRAFDIGAGARNINASALNFTNTGTSAGSVINSTGQSGGTISFGNVGITGYNVAAGTAVNLAGTAAGSVLFGDLDITTTAGAALNVGAITFNPGSSSTISAGVSNAVTFSGTTASGGVINFASVSSSGGTNGISMTNVIGTTNFNSVTISGSLGDGISLNNAGTVNIRSGSIRSVGGDGIDSTNTSLFVGVDSQVRFGQTGFITGSAIRYRTNNAGNYTLDIFDSPSFANVNGSGVDVDHSGSGIVTVNIGSTAMATTGTAANILKTGTGDLRLSITSSAFSSTGGSGWNINGATGTGSLIVTQASDSLIASAAVNGVTFDTVVFDGDTATVGIQAVSSIGLSINGIANGHGLRFNNATGTLAFDDLIISNTGGTGLFVNSALNLSSTTGSISTTTGAAMQITNATLGLVFTGVSSTNSPSHGLVIGTGTSGTANLGNVVMTGTNAASYAVNINNSAAVVTAASLNLNGGARGVHSLQNTGSFTVTGTTTIQNTSDTGIYVELGDVAFSGNVTITGGAYGMRLGSAGIKNFGNVDINNASTAGIVLGGMGVTNGGVNIGILSIDVTGGTDGIIVNAYNNVASFGATTIGTVGNAGSGGSLHGLFLTNPGVITPGSLTFASLTIAEAGIGIRSTNNNINLSVTGATTLSNIATTGIDVQSATGNFQFQNITLTGPVATGIRFGANTGIFTATGTTNLTGVTGIGINANAATGTYNFGVLNIGFTGAGRGIDFRDSSVRFETNNFSLAGNGTAGSIGIDLSGSLNPNGANSATANIRLAKDAGETAAISGVATGVKLGDAVDGSAGANFVYGNQTPLNSGSSIAVIAGGTTIDTSNLVSTNPTTQGRYEFQGVLFTGQATFEGTNPNFLFVGTNAAGAANGSNPNNRISTATFLASFNTAVALAGKTVVFVNDNVAGINLGANTLNLGASTVLAGFGNGATVTVAGGIQPVNVIGDTFVPGGGNFTDANGAATVLTNAATSTLTLNTGNTLSNFILGSGATSIVGTNFGTITINGMVINNPVGGAMTLNTGALAGTGFTSVTTGGGVNAISLTNVTGSINFGSGSLSGATGSTFFVSGGTVSTTYSGNMTQASSGALVTVAGGHNTGTLLFQTGTLSATSGDGFLFDNADGVYNFNGTTTLNGGLARIRVLNGSAGTFTFGAGTSITSPTVTAFFADSSSANITYNGTITQNNAAHAVDFENNTGGTSTFGGLITASTSALDPIRLLGNAGATINFNGGLNLTTTTGDGFNAAGGGTVTVAATAGAETITTTGGVAVNLSGITIGAAGITWDSITASGATAVSGIILANTGNTGAFTVTGTTAISGRAGDAIDITGTGNANFGTVNITGRTGSALGIDIQNSSGTLVFGNTTLTNLGNSSGFGINYFASTGSATFAQTNIDQNGATTSALVLSDSNGSFTSNGGAITGSLAHEVFVSAGTGTVSIASNITNTTGGSIVVTNRPGLAGNVTFSGNINDTGTGMDVATNSGGVITFSGASKVFNTGTDTAVSLVNNTGATINFTNGGLAITTTSGTGFNATGGGTITVQGTGNTITTTGGIAANVNGVTIGAAGINWDSITASGATANSGILLANTGNTGAFTVAGTTTISGRSSDSIDITGTGNATFGVVNITGRTGTARGIDISSSSGTLVFGNTTLTNLGNSTGIGIRYASSTGSAIFAQTNINDNDAGVTALFVTGSSGSFTSNGGTITRSSAEEVFINAGTGTVNIASAVTNTSSGSILVSGRTGGNVTFSGNISDTGAGMDVTNNTGGTITFSGASKVFNTGADSAVILSTNGAATINFTNGGLDIDTTTGVGFLATGGGTVTVQGTGNTINTTGGGTAMSLNGVTIGAAGVTWDSITANGASANFGIILTSTGNTGTFTVTGTTTVSGRSADSINITGTGNATFGVVNVTGRTGSAIGIDMVNSSGTLVFGNTTLTNAGNSFGAGIRYFGSTGSATFAQTNIDQDNSSGNALLVSGSNGSFTSNGGTITDSSLDEVSVTGGTGTVNIASAISNSSGGVVNVDNRTAGNVTFSGNITSTAGGGITVATVTGGTVTFSGSTKSFTATTATPVLLIGNTGGTINFTNGGLVINTTALAGFSATGGGTVTVQGSGNTITTTTGQAFNMVNTDIGANDITFASINTGTAAVGIILDVVGANDFTVNNGSITATSRGVDINGGSGNVTIGASIITSGLAARSVEITGHTGGTVAFSGSLFENSLGMSLSGNTGGTYNFSGSSKTFSTGANTAVSLTGNAGAEINFTGGSLSITTSTGNGFVATGGGVVTVQGTFNSINSGAATALEFSGGTTFGAADVTFRSISANGGTTAGIILNGTGTVGTFAVTGDGTAANNNSGGSIINKSTSGDGTDGITLTNAPGVTLNQMRLEDNGRNGIFATGDMNGLTISRSNILSNADQTNHVATPIDESGVYIWEATGTVNITNTTISNSYETDLRIENSSGMIVANVTNSTISNNGASGFAGNLFNFLGSGTANMTLNVTGSSFTGNRTVGALTVDAIHADASDGTMTVNVASSTFTNNFVAISTSIGGLALDPDLIFDLNGNNIQGSEGSSIIVFANTNLASGASITGKIRNNIIGTLNTVRSGSLLGRGIDLSNEGSINTTVSITGNTISETYADSIFVIQNVNAVNAGTTNVTITGNTLQNFYTTPNVSNAFGISVNLTTTGTLNTTISGNTLTDTSAPTIANKIRIRRTNGTFNISQLNEATVGTANGLTGAAEVDALGTITYGQPLPTLPPLLFSGEAAPSSTGATLTMDSLNSLATAAVARWMSSGLTEQQTLLLQNVSFSITSLPEGYLGAALPGVVMLSNNTAGNTWFIDATPFDDSEFTGDGTTLTATTGSAAAGSIDALTVILHELGHQLGFEDGYGSGAGGSLMEGHLTLGQRFLPVPGSALSLPLGGMTQNSALPLTFQPAPSTAGSVMNLVLPQPKRGVRGMGTTQGFKSEVHSTAPLEWNQTLPVPASHMNEFLIIPLFIPSPLGELDLRMEDDTAPLPIEFQRASVLQQQKAQETKGTSAMR